MSMTMCLQTKRKIHSSNAFTIVELLIVIVVIAILAAISVVAYNGVQARAQQSKINSDLGQLQKAISGARINAGVSLRYVTGCTHTGGAISNCSVGSSPDSCYHAPSGTDLKTLSQCITQYNLTLTRISDASGIDVKNLLDPWGRPYYIDENEQEPSPTSCTRDKIAVYALPHVTNSQVALQNQILIPNSIAGC